jgi:hypothetical protein
MKMKTRMLIVAALAALAALVPGGAALGGGADPARFTGRVTNPWFPLKPGTTYVYRGTRDGKPARDVVTVTHQTKTIQGVRCEVVKDRLYLSGRLRERTTDWYTQDVAGNVWYFGEATAELDGEGRVVSRNGSWQAGRDGAKPGIFMPAHPRPGYTGRQEFYKGHAEDHFRILSLTATVKVPLISSRHALLTREWTPLESGVIDHKYYVRGIGTVREEAVKGGHERMELASMRLEK